MKRIVLTGRLTADPDYKEYEKEDRTIKRATFGLANNDKGKEHAQYFDVLCWGEQAEFTNSYLKRGNKILVCGSFDLSTYVSKTDNKKRLRFQVVPDRIEFIG